MTAVNSAVACIQSLVWLAVGLSLHLGCRPARDPDQWVVAVDAPVKDLDPRLAVDGPSARLSRLVFSGLTQVDEHGTPALDLAALITLETALVARVHLRPNLRFHDGQPLTAADVALTYSTVLDPAFGTPIGSEFRKRLAAVVADPVDALVVRFVLRKPLATLWTDLVVGIAPAHLLRHAVKQRFAGPVIGSGPWRVRGVANGERVEVERFDLEGIAAVGTPKRLVFRAIADEGARALAVLGGGADVAWSGLSPAVLRGAQATADARVIAAAGIAFTYLGFNLRHPKLHDPRVRRALALALDRQTLIAAVLGGRARLADGLFAAGHWARVDLPVVPYDPHTAARLLDQAGLVAGPDGVRLHIDIKVSTSRMRRQLARALADQWRAIGVQAQVRPFELSTFLADVRAGRFEVFVLQLPEPFEPDQLAWMLHSQNAAVKTADLAAPSPYAQMDRRGIAVTAWDAALDSDPVCANWQKRKRMEGLLAFSLAAIGNVGATGSANRSGYAQPWVDCWLDLGAAAFDRPTRKSWYAKAQHQIALDLPIVPLWWEDIAVLVAPNVDGLQLPADGRYSVLGAMRHRAVPPP